MKNLFMNNYNVINRGVYFILPGYGLY